MPTEYWAIDVETTGLYAGSDRVVSIGAIQFRDLQPTGKMFYYIFNPERRCHPIAASVHGYSDALLARQDRFSDFAGELFQELARPRCLVGFNIGFDRGFLEHEFSRCGYDLSGFRFVCCMKRFKSKVAMPSYKLDHCAAHIGVGRSGKQHGAMEDALLAAQIHTWLKTRQIVTATIPGRPLNLR